MADVDKVVDVRKSDGKRLSRRGRGRGLGAALGVTALIAALLGFVPAADAQGFFCDGHRVTIVGSPGDDFLVGTSGRDVIHGFAGNDTIQGRGGNDIICGGWGNDRLNGGAGWDRIFGMGGWDTILGGPGDDRLYGARGNDFISAGPGQDVVRGGPGNDRIRGRDGNNQLDGGQGNDIIFRNPNFAIPTVRRVYYNPRAITPGKTWTEPIFEASIGGYAGNYRLTLDIVDAGGAAAQCEILTANTGGFDLTYSHFPGGSNPLISSIDISALAPVTSVAFTAGNCGGTPGQYALKSWTLERTSGWPL